MTELDKLAAKAIDATWGDGSYRTVNNLSLSAAILEHVPRRYAGRGAMLPFAPSRKVTPHDY